MNCSWALCCVSQKFSPQYEKGSLRVIVGKGKKKEQVKGNGETYAIDVEFVNSLQLDASSDESGDVDRQLSTLASASAIC